jgi:hypothetical protein
MCRAQQTQQPSERVLIVMAVADYDEGQPRKQLTETCQNLAPLPFLACKQDLLRLVWLADLAQRGR